MRRKRRAMHELEARNQNTAKIWGSGGIYRLIGREIFPLPFTRYTFWVRKGYFRIFHITHYDLID